MILARCYDPGEEASQGTLRAEIVFVFTSVKDDDA